VDTCGKIDLPNIDIYTNLKNAAKRHGYCPGKRKDSGDKKLMIWANLNFIPESLYIR
jgi:hypothetical protein